MKIPTEVIVSKNVYMFYTKNAKQNSNTFQRRLRPSTWPYCLKHMHLHLPLVLILTMTKHTAVKEESKKQILATKAQKLV